MAATGQTAGEYISHHLQNLTVCKQDGEWVWNECQGNFFALNVDSMFFALALGILLTWFFARVAKKASIGQPTKTQALIQASMKLGEAMYANAQASGEADDATATADDGVVDAEFEEVSGDDDEKKSA